VSPVQTQWQLRKTQQTKIRKLPWLIHAVLGKFENFVLRKLKNLFENLYRLISAINRVSWRPVECSRFQNNGLEETDRRTVHFQVAIGVQPILKFCSCWKCLINYRHQLGFAAVLYRSASVINIQFIKQRRLIFCRCFNCHATADFQPRHAHDGG